MKLTNVNGLQIATSTQLVKMTDGQNGLLKLITDSVKKGKEITLRDIVLCYVANVRTICYDRYTNIPYYVWDSFKKQDFNWTYTVRGMVKQWFTNTIGVLVIKNKLMVLPIINADL